MKLWTIILDLIFSQCLQHLIINIILCELGLIKAKMFRINITTYVLIIYLVAFNINNLFFCIIVNAY